MANDADLRVTPPRGQNEDSFSAANTRAGPAADKRLPPPGTVITREYKSRTLEVKVLSDGFEFEGEVYGSLSAVARAATGAHWNGFHFFGLQKKRGD